MPSESDSAVTAGGTFCDVACRLGYLSAADAQRVQVEAERQSRSPGQTALELGLLDAVQVDAAETLLRPLDAIPGYEILDVLGRGGMGMVYLARQTSLGRIVALKTVLVSRLNDAAALKRFEQEARVLAQLRHPNIISIYDFGRAAGRLYFAMERVEGSDVAKLLERSGPLDEATAWGIARQAAAGLSHAERQGIVHRDIKPANLMLVQPPDGFPLPSGVPMVQIADFGLALLTEQADSCTRLTSDNATVGSPHYMAPEQFRGSRVDLRADIYSLGATVYEMLVDRPPFDGLTLPQIIGQKLSAGPEALAALRFDLAHETVDLVQRMMHSEPEGRPSGYAALLVEIEAVLHRAGCGRPAVALRHESREGEATVIGLHAETREVRPVGTSMRGARRAITSRWKWFVSGVLLVGVLGITLRFWPDHPPVVVPQRVEMAEIGPGRYLFNGTTILDWTTVSGQWAVPPGESVIAGRDGLLSRTLFKEVDGRPVAPAYYRLVLLVHPQDAGAAEVHFGLTAVSGRNGPRYVVRLTSDDVALGERSSDAAVLSNSTTYPIAVADAAVVTLERQPTGWFISVNDQSLQPVPLRIEELPEFRLAAEGGTAWFSDVEIVELSPANR
jgi:serine/threonine protein kinase